MVVPCDNTEQTMITGMPVAENTADFVLVVKCMCGRSIRTCAGHLCVVGRI